MAEFRDRVIGLSEAAWRLRRSAPVPCELPFALALFSDAKRMSDPLAFVEALPRDLPPLAVVFRHDELPAERRAALAHRVRNAAQARGHLFLMARGALDGADGCHGFEEGRGTRTASVHDEEEIAQAVPWADAGFLSPVHPTDSHPGAPALGRERAVALAQASRLPLFALGGMDAGRAAELEGTPFQGFGAIGAFTQD